MKIGPILLLLGLAPLHGAQTSVPAPLHQVTVDLAGTGLSLDALLARDFDVVFRHAGTQRFDVLADDATLARLRGLELPVELVQEDLASFYEERLAQGALQARTEAASLGAWLSPPFASGGMGGYYTWAEVSSVLDQIATAYPAITTDRFSIGASLEGRQIWAIKVSDNPDVDENEPEVRFDSMHHAREPEGMQATLWALLCTWPRTTARTRSPRRSSTPVRSGSSRSSTPMATSATSQTNPNGGGLWRKNRRDNGNGTTSAST